MKEKSVAQLIQELQQVFNLYVRSRDKGKPCISCDDKYPSDAGHLFKKSTRPGMRFHPMACHLQCRNCNSIDDGNYEAFCTGLAKRYGPEYLEAVIQDANESRRNTHKWSRSELHETIKFYRDAIKKLKT